MTLLSLLGVALAGAAQEPARLEAVDPVRQRVRVGDRPSRPLRSSRSSWRVGDRDAGALQALQASPASTRLRRRLGDRPSRRSPGTRAASASPGQGTSSGPTRPGVPASPPTRADDLVGDLPGVLQRRRDDAGAALALVVVAAFAVERVHRRLEAVGAAKARRADGRADHLRAERGAHHAAADRRGRAARRAAGRVLEIPRDCGCRAARWRRIRWSRSCRG